MRKYLLALALIPGLALAGPNISQNDNSTANWEGSGGSEAGIGAFLTVRLTALSTASTGEPTLAPFDGIIHRFRATLDSDITGTSDILRVVHSTSQAGPWVDVEGASGTITVGSGTDTGAVLDSGPLTGGNTVSAGDVIAVMTDGASTDGIGATVIIELRLR